MRLDTLPMRQVVLDAIGSAILTLTIAVALIVGFAPSVRAQALDSVVTGLLQNNCSALGFDPGGGNSGFGNDLTRVCSNGAQGVPAASGGGAASPQTSAQSIENGIIQQRLERARQKSKRSEGDDSATAAMLFRGRPGTNMLTRASRSEGGGSSVSSGRFDVFASGSYESLDRKSTPFEDAFDSSIKGATVGFDYQFNDRIAAGLVAGYRKQDGDFSQGGDLAITTFEPSAYVSVLPSPRTFLQVVAGYGAQSSDVHRSILYTITPPTDPPSPPTVVASGLAASAPDSKAYSGAARFGYDRPVGRFTWGPRLGVNYNHATIDPYTETGSTGLELGVHERTVTSFQGVVGFYASAALGGESGVFVPQLNLEYVREFEDTASIVTARFAQDNRGADATSFTYQTNAPDEGFVNIDAGVGAVLAHGVQLFLNLRKTVGNDLFTNLGGTIGLRLEL